MRCLLSIAMFVSGVASMQAQSVIVDRQVVGSTGAFYSGGQHEVSSTAGEAVIATGQSANEAWTQGFQQPLTKNILVFEVLTEPESCVGARDGSAHIPSISGCEPPYNILWSNGATGMSVTGFETGEHSVSVSTGACQTTLTFFIGLEDETPCDLQFYSGITPNGDGQNDYWHIENIHLPRFANNEVRIFNRWGEEVWKGKNYDNQQVRWEGQGKRQAELPDGTYFYVAEINGTSYKGYIELTR